MDLAFFDDECIDTEAMKVLLDDGEDMVPNRLPIVGSMKIFDVGSVEQIEAKFGELRFKRKGSRNDDAGKGEESRAAGAEVEVAAFVDEDIERWWNRRCCERRCHSGILLSFREIARFAGAEVL